MKKIITSLSLGVFLAAPYQVLADTSQYIGGGIQYGVLSTDGRSEDRTTLMYQGRLGLNLTRNWVLELEAGVSPDSEETVKAVCIEGEVTFLNPEGNDVVCSYNDSFSRQSVRVNAMYRLPLGSAIDIFAAVGLGVIRTDFDFTLASATYGDESYSAAELNDFLINYNLLVSEENELSLNNVGDETGASVDFAYSLEVGTVIADQHRIGVSYVPEYGNDSIGNFSYVGISYAWLYRFDPF